MKRSFWILVLVTIAALALFVVLRRRQAETPTIAVLTSAGNVTLSLLPASLTSNLNQASTVSMQVNSATEKLTVVKYEISYDPSKLTVSNVTVGSWLTKSLSGPTVGNGKISGILGAQPDPNLANGGPELNRTGTGTLLTFQVKPLVYGTNMLSFVNANTEAVTGTNNLNSLKATNNASVSAKLLSDLVGTTRRVDVYDYTEFLLQFGHAGSADFNGSGTVDIYDYSTFISDFGKTW